MIIKTKYKALFIIIIIIVLLFLFYTFFIQIRRIESGNIGVKASITNPAMSSDDYDVTVVHGYVWFIPLLTELTIYSTNVQSVNYNDIVANTKDASSFKIESTISYQLNEKGAIKFYKSFGKSLKDIDKNYLKNIIQSTYDSEISRFTSDSLIQNKSVLDHTIDSVLSVKLHDMGLTLCNMVSNLEYPEEVNERIKLRAKTVQEQIIANNQKQQAENEVQIQLIKADATRVQDSLVNSALTPLAIQKMFVDKWDGKLPVYGDTPKIYKDISGD